MAKKEDHSLLMHTFCGTIIQIGPEIQCLPYAGFFFLFTCCYVKFNAMLTCFRHLYKLADLFHINFDWTDYYCVDHHFPSPSSHCPVKRFLLTRSLCPCSARTSVVDFNKLIEKNTM